jgi:hypothetical protein
MNEERIIARERLRELVLGARKLGGERVALLLSGLGAVNDDLLLQVLAAERRLRLLELGRHVL